MLSHRVLNSGNSRMHDIVAFQENMSLPRVKGVKFNVHDIIINIIIITGQR